MQPMVEARLVCGFPQSMESEVLGAGRAGRNKESVPPWAASLTLGNREGSPRK